MGQRYHARDPQEVSRRSDLQCHHLWQVAMTVALRRSHVWMLQRGPLQRCANCASSSSSSSSTWLDIPRLIVMCCLHQHIADAAAAAAAAGVNLAATHEAPNLLIMTEITL